MALASTETVGWALLRASHKGLPAHLIILGEWPRLPFTARDFFARQAPSAPRRAVAPGEHILIVRGLRARKLAACLMPSRRTTIFRFLSLSPSPASSEERPSTARSFSYDSLKGGLGDSRLRASNHNINGHSELARTSPQGDGLDLSLTARIDRARPLI